MERLRVTVMGLGLFDGGVAVTRHLVGLGHDVTVTDLKSRDALARSVEALAGLPVRLRLGGHDEGDFRAADLVIVNPAVPPGNRYVELARRAGARLDTEIGLFFRQCPAPIVGVTGTAGKSTTSALLADCLRAAAEAGAAGAPRHVWLGGNIGRSLLRDLPRIGPADVVVLELSSFQLHWLGPEGLRPAIGVLTNLTPNHLDWHVTMADYAEAKRAVLPSAGGVVVVCADDPGVMSLAEGAACRVLLTSRRPLPEGADGVFWRAGSLVSRAGDGEAEILRDADVRLLGGHAAWNVASAAAAGLAAGAGAEHVRSAVRAFEGLPHRLRPVGTYAGMLCVDDSKSTTPSATASALAAFDRPLVLLAGGYDKGLPAAPLVEAAAQRAQRVICYGATGPALAAALRERGGPEVALVEGLLPAVEAAFEGAVRGGVLLLSPGHASWDQFENYEERGRVFADACAKHGSGGGRGYTSDDAV